VSGSDALKAKQQAVLALTRMQARLDTLERQRREPIAVVGLACRFPGADDAAAFWRLLHDGVEAVADVPAGRWDADAFYDPSGAAGTMYTRRAGFLREVDRFDPQFFGISPREAASMDPQQRLLLEVAWEALEDAGMAPDRLAGSATGVFVGICNNDYPHLGAGAEAIDAYSGTGAAFSVAAGRISYTLGLQGPSIAIDTACSSSLVAIHLACQSLRTGETRMALAGGVNLILSPLSMVALCSLGMLSPEGRCKTFDAGADGFVRGEGCGLVVLKRLSDAQADGDRILAVLRGSAVNQDGRSSGLTAPNGPAQEAVLRAALEASGVEPGAVSYVEAHGTGTQLGDPIEVGALRAVLGAGRDPGRPLSVGSVKTNVGHLESAAGIAGLIKVILALCHGEIPPHLHLRQLNPHIAPGGDVVVPTRPVPWPAGPRLAGVSSFGFSGTNAHVIVEEAPASEAIPEATLHRPIHLLALSARSRPALERLAGLYAGQLEGTAPADWPDVCFTANAGRAHFAHRLAVVTEGAAAAREALAAFAAGRPSPSLLAGEVPDEPPRVAFLFTGQGTQHAGMGSGLLATQPVFRRTLEQCDEILRPHLGWRSLLEILAAPEGGPSPLDDTAVAQPALFALEYALVRTLSSWGIEPAAVLGHSVGEYAAACVAGAFSLEEGLELVAERARLMAELPRDGAMAVVFAGEERIAPALAGHAGEVAVAALNGPGDTVLSGERRALEAVLAGLRAAGIESRSLVVSHAFHSRLIEPALPGLERAVERVRFSPLRLGLVGNLTGAFVRDEELARPSWWSRHARQPVRFADGLRTLRRQGYDVLVEIGPRPSLTALGRRCLPEDPEILWLPTLRPGRDDWSSLTDTVARLYLRGVPVDWEGWDRGAPRRKVSLPTYPFQRRRHWREAAPAPPPPSLAEVCAVRWEEAPPAGEPARDLAGSWVVLADADEALAGRLTAAGVRCVAVPSGEGPADTVEACAALLDLVQSLARLEAGQRARLHIVTRSAQEVTGTEPVRPAAAALWGLGRTVALEHPELWGGLIDLDPREGGDEDLLAELGRPSGTGIAFRDGRRFTARLVPTGPAAAATFKPEGAWLITGGLGALGLAVARWLVEAGVRHLVLAGRRGAEGLDEAGRHTLDELAAAGTRIDVAAADAADPAALARAVEMAGPELRGVVHAAGVLDDGVLLRQDRARFERVLAPKASGAWNLHLLTRDLPLDAFVLFSSAAGLLGSPGQGSYAAANAFLDGLACLRRAQGLPALSVDWGLWDGPGMGTRAGARHADRRLSPRQALATLGTLLAGPEGVGPQVAVLPPGWLEAVPTAPPPPPPRPATTGEAPLAERLARTVPAERPAVLRGHVEEEVRSVLRLDPAQPLKPRQGFFDLGLDSLMAVELRHRLQTAVGDRLSLPSTLVFDHPTLEALSGFLGEGLLGTSGMVAAEILAGAAAPAREAGEPLAIVGMAFRFPGGADDPESFWRLLRDGVDAIAEVPPDRWDADAYYDPDPDAPGKMVTRWGGFLEGIDRFDARFFGISRREAVSMDPQQRLLLEVGWTALESAGLAPDHLAGSSTGVFVGISGNDYARRVAAAGAAGIDAYAGTGSVLSAAAGRISYALGLHGPSLAVDTACSSSLVAVHLAGQSLLSGECDLALAGGVNVILAPEVNVNLSRARMMAADGRCKTFDARADGYVRGEGCGVVVLKLLSRALADGDRVLALVRGSAVNQDGRSIGLTAPNGPAQEAVVRAALARAGVEPSTVGYIEAHGTGTPLGDPIELGALAAVFGPGRAADRPLLVGSVKTNLGHLEAAAGVAGLIKAVLALERGEVPPHLHLQTLNPHIDLGDAPLVVPTVSASWPIPDGPRRAGVSSFGFIGTNAHIVLEQAPSPLEEPAEASPERGRHLLALSARSPESLRSLAAAWRRKLEEEGAPLADLAFSAHTGRSAFPHRLAVAAAGSPQAAEGLAAFLEERSAPGLVTGSAAAEEPPRIAFLFSGQGAQLPGMGRRLAEAWPAFRHALERCDEVLRGHPTFRERSLLSLLWEATGEELRETALLQPALFALEHALAELWLSWGVEPAVVVGHSLGAYAAACTAGMLPLDEALLYVAERGRLMATLPRGSMAAVRAGEERVREVLDPWTDRVALAAVNGSDDVTLSGETGAVEEVLAELERRGIAARRLPVSHAFHSPLVEPVLDELERLAAGISFAPPRRLFVSDTTGRPLAAGEVLDAAGWRRHAREPVRFGAALDAVRELGCRVLVEVGPGANLLALARRRLGEGGADLWLPTLRSGRDEEEQVLDSLGRLWVAGAAVDWRGFDQSRPRRRVAVPTYPFERRRYWIDLEIDLEPVAPKAPDLAESLCELRWEPLPAAAGALEAGGPWVILAEPGDALAARLAEELDAPAPVSPDAFRADSPSGERRIVLFPGTAAGTPDLAALQEAHDRACGDLIHLVQTLGTAASGARLWIVTRGAQAVLGTGPDLAQAPLWGLARVLALEHPELRPVRIDLDPAASETEALAALRTELAAGDEEQVAWRGDQRLVAHLAPLPLARPAGHLEIRSETTWLVTGGLGALGLQVATRLVERGARSVVLAGRRAPDEAVLRRIAELEARGARIAVRRCDVARTEEVMDLLAWMAAELPPLSGIVHAAGVLDDGVLLRQDRERLARVLAPKVAGAWNLHSLTLGLPLEAFVCFSSAASLLGAPGQGSYAAANAFLDALAWHRRAQGLPALAIDWPAWIGEGMAARTAVAARRRGLEPISPEAGLDLLERLLREDATALPPQVGVLPRAEEAREAERAPREAASLRRELAALPGRRRGAAVLARIETEVAAVLQVDPAELDADQGLFDLGLDSLMAVELRNRLQSALGETPTLPATVVFDHPSVRALAAFLAEVLTDLPAAASTAPAVSRDEPVAIVGLGCRFPGGADGPAAFWRLLRDGVDAVVEVPADRWDAGALFDPDPEAPGKSYSRWGGFLSGVDRFDAPFFGISPREAVSMDPQQRLLLEVAWEALEHAGLPPDRLARSRTGVFVGISGNDYASLPLRAGGAAGIDAYFGTGSSTSAAAGRLSYVLGLQGPSMAVDTACSSSLVAVHLACQSLRAGECDLALAGGVNLILTPEAHINLSRARMLAADGRCKTFDATADGYVRGEGCGLVVLKPLSAALAAGDPVLAVIRATAVNQDGPSVGLTAPNGQAQQAVVREALERAGLEPGAIDYVEAHGTGTALGDPIELGALAAALGAGRSPDQPLLVGSVKTNLGHLEAAAGVAGLIKVVLALRHGEIPPHLHLRELNPRIDTGGVPFRVPGEPTPWPAADGPRRAGISSFGFVGTNAHAVLEEAPAPPPPPAPSRTAHLLVLSAKLPEALRELASRYAALLETIAPVDFAPLCAAAATGRSAFPWRLAVVATSAAEVRVRLEAHLRGEAAEGVVTGRAERRDLAEEEPLRLAEGEAEAAGLERLARLWVQGAAVDWEAVTGPGGRDRVELPTYPFQRHRYWIDLIEPVQAIEAPALPGRAAHPALGTRVRAAVRATLFERRLSAESPAFLADHRIYGEVVVPGAFHLSLALAAAAEVLQSSPCTLTEVSFPAALTLPAGEPRALQTAVTPAGPGQARVEILSLREEEGGEPEWTLHAAASLAAGAPVEAAPSLSLEELRARHALSEAAPLYSMMDQGGVGLGPAFRWIERLWADGREALAEMRSLDAGTGVPGHPLPPGLIDSCFQLLGATLPLEDLEARAYIPVAVERFAFHPPAAGRLWAHAVLHAPAGRETFVADLRLFDAAGRVVASIDGVRLKAAGRSALARADLRRRLEWLYRLDWREAPAPVETQTPRRWIVLADRGGLGRALMERLSARGAECSTEIGSLPNEETGIVWLQGLDATAGEEAGAAQERICGGLLPVLRAAAAAGRPPRLWIVTRGAQQVDGEPVAALAQAPLWGLGRTLAMEHPELRCVRIDLDPAGSKADQLDALLAELSTPADEDQVAWRRGGRRMARLVRDGGPLPAAGFQASEDVSYLITGGLGALGLLVARWLADRGARSLILLGRRPPGAEARAALDGLAARGVRVLPLQADVARREELAAALDRAAAEMPPLAGVLHAAGVLDDGVLLRQDWPRFAQVLAPKIGGAWNLHELTRGLPLDLFVLFSSAAALLGSPGQGSYAAGNAFLDALAGHRRALGLPALSIAWGAWSGGGMAAEADARTQERWSEQGIGRIDPRAGLEVLDLLLARPAGPAAPHVAVLPVSWPSFLARAGRPIPFFADLAQEGAGRPEEAADEVGQALRERLRATPENQRLGLLREHVREQVRSVLRLDPSFPLDLDQPLTELGLDSLVGLELTRALGASVGRAVPATLLYEQPTLEALSGWLASELLETVGVEEPAAEFADLSVDEMESLLAQELQEIDRMLSNPAP
jgi:acyl transferase domain-containing protein/aryl carrier-like protein